MRIPYVVARVSKVLVNPVFALIAGRVPPWALVHHRGRRTGRAYRAVVWMFGSDRRLAVALTYSAQHTDWVKNVLAAGGCTVERRGRRIEVTRARLVGPEEGRPLMPAILRPGQRLFQVRDYLVLEAGA